MAIRLCFAIEHANIINEVLTAIRDSAVSLERLGHADFLPAELAGQYAFHALDDCGDKVTAENVVPHLEYLLAEGVEFDVTTATSHALAIAAERQA